MAQLYMQVSGKKQWTIVRYSEMNNVVGIYGTFDDVDEAEAARSDLQSEVFEDTLEVFEINDMFTVEEEEDGSC